jgi:FKBP-type peptidyl-prolyl cis-trans isomerase FkpA
MKSACIITILIFLLVSCKDDKPQSEIDEGIIVEYLKTNNLTAQRHSSGLYYIITEPGQGGGPAKNSIITVKYKGYFTNGNVFDQTTGDETLESPLDELIEGWIFGIPLLQKGGKGIFFIPSELGYGSQDRSGIPANSVLIFDIELIGFR